MTYTAKEYLPEVTKGHADDKSKVFQLYQVTDMKDDKDILRKIPVPSERTSLLMLEEERARLVARLAEIDEKIAVVTALLAGK